MRRILFCLMVVLFPTIVEAQYCTNYGWSQKTIRIAVDRNDSKLEKGIVHWVQQYQQVMSNRTLELVAAHEDAEIRIVRVRTLSSSRRRTAWTDVVHDESKCSMIEALVTVSDLDQSGEELGEGLWLTVLGHELGHAFGLPHLPSMSSLMSDGQKDERPWLSQQDIAALKRVYR